MVSPRYRLRVIMSKLVSMGKALFSISMFFSRLFESVIQIVPSPSKFFLIFPSGEGLIHE